MGLSEETRDETTNQTADATYGNVTLPGACDQEVSFPVLGIPYTVISKLGNGGMAEVFLARQNIPERLVALKLISSQKVASDYLTRFEAEYQTLGMMNHPRIAAVYDVGITETGLPYFTMEYVPGGLAITTYCREKNLDIKQRLKLFLQVCDGVFHAHQHAVVHRDLKPANILVTDSGTNPAAKIIDFGIAKHLKPGSLFDCQTKSCSLLGTPAYMSPEQLMGGNMPIGTRTDIYALGLILYELLTDQTPYDAERLKELSFDERLRIYRTEEPPLASERVGPGDRKRYAFLRGDLDAVLVRAMAKKRENRYETVADLAKDIGNVLDQRPVSARTPGLLYLMTRFVKRNRFPVLSAAGIVLILLALARASWEANQKQAARDSANGLNQLMEAVQWTPDPGFRDEARELHILADLEDKLQNWSGEADHLKAETHHTLAEFYLVFGRYGDAVEHFIRALNIEIRLSGEDSQVVAMRRKNLSRAHRRNGHREAARLEAEKAFAWYQAHHDINSAVRANAAVTLALALPPTGQYFSESESLLKSAIRALSQARGPAHRETLLAISSYANLLLRQHNYAQAEEMYRQVLGRGRKVYGDSHPPMLAARKNLATALWQQGNLVEAEKLLRETLALRRFILPDDHMTITRSLYSLGGVLLEVGKYDEADEVLAKVAKRFGDADQTGNALGAVIWLARARWLAGKRNEAIACLDEAVAQCRANGYWQRQSLRVMNNMVTYLIDSKRLDKALVVIGEIQQIKWPESGLGTGPRYTRLNQARLHQAMGAFDHAEQIYAELQAGIDKGEFKDEVLALWVSVYREMLRGQIGDRKARERLSGYLPRLEDPDHVEIKILVTDFLGKRQAP